MGAGIEGSLGVMPHALPWSRAKGQRDEGAPPVARPDWRAFGEGLLRAVLPRSRMAMWRHSGILQRRRLATEPHRASSQPLFVKSLFESQH